MERKFDSVIPPDRPDSPVPAWQHYYISKETEDRIIKELEENHKERLLVGLCIGYLFIPNDKPKSEADNKFSMPHGYLVDCEDEEIEDERPESAPIKIKQKGGLGDNFISELYKEVNQLILQNAPEGIGEYLVSLEVTTAHFSRPQLLCEGQKCGFCAAHHKRHVLKKKNKSPTQCTWVCTGDPCRG